MPALPSSNPAGTFGAAAYGGAGWSQRTASAREEIGTIWAACGADSEWAPLKAVLLHRPGPEIVAGAPDALQMLDRLDLGRAQAEHDALAAAYREAGVAVHEVAPEDPPSANLMFLADLLFMTPEGALLARPASTVRAGEERQVARRLAALGMPILRSFTGQATFEGADAMWLDPKTVLIGRGLRTNQPGIDQAAATLAEVGVSVVAVDLPYGTMHLMGMLRIVDRDLAVAWPRRIAHAAVAALRERGCELLFLPSDDDAVNRPGLNFVTLAPRRILMVADNPCRRFYEAHGIECLTSPAGELAKAAGAIGCLSGVLWREMA